MNRRFFIFLILFTILPIILLAQNNTQEELLEYFQLTTENELEYIYDDLDLESISVILWHNNYEYIGAWFWVVHDKGGRWMPLVIEAGLDYWLEPYEVILTIDNESFSFNSEADNYWSKQESSSYLDNTHLVKKVDMFCELDPELMIKIISADIVYISIITADDTIELELYNEPLWQEIVPHLYGLH